MPTPPRRRPATPPTRRPRVAGLRKPASPAERPDSTPDTVNTPDTPVEAAAAPGTRLSETGPADTRLDDTDYAVPADSHPDSDSADPADADTPADLDERTVSVPVIGADPEPDAEDPHTTRGEPDDRAVSAADADGDADGDAGDSPEDEPADDSPARPVGKRPSGRRRSTGATRPDDLVRAERGTGLTKVETAPERRAAGLNLAIVLAVIALAVGGLAVFLKGQVDALTSEADSDNTSIIDSAGTSEVKGKLTVALERALSYNYTDLAVTEAAVRESLSGKAVCEYEQLFGQLRELAPAQKLVLSTKVRQMGVVSLRGDAAEVLVFVDQSTTRTDQNQTTASGAQFAVRAQREAGVWKVTEFDMLAQPLPGGQTPAGC